MHRLARRKEDFSLKFFSFSLETVFESWQGRGFLIKKCAHGLDMFFSYNEYALLEIHVNLGL